MLELIAAHKKTCGCELVDHLEMARSAVSAHPKVLKRAGLVADRRDAFRAFCRVSPETASQAFRGLEASLDEHTRSAENEDPEARVGARLAVQATAGQAS